MASRRARQPRRRPTAGLARPREGSGGDAAATPAPPSPRRTAAGRRPGPRPPHAAVGARRGDRLARRKQPVKSCPHRARSGTASPRGAVGRRSDLEGDEPLTGTAAWRVTAWPGRAPRGRRSSSASRSGVRTTSRRTPLIPRALPSGCPPEVVVAQLAHHHVDPGAWRSESDGVRRATGHGGRGGRAAADPVPNR